VGWQWHLAKPTFDDGEISNFFQIKEKVALDEL